MKSDILFATRTAKLNFAPPDLTPERQNCYCDLAADTSQNSSQEMYVLLEDRETANHQSFICINHSFCCILQILSARLKISRNTRILTQACLGHPLNDLFRTQNISRHTRILTQACLGHPLNDLFRTQNISRNTRILTQACLGHPLNDLFRSQNIE